MQHVSLTAPKNRPNGRDLSCVARLDAAGGFSRSPGGSRLTGSSASTAVGPQQEATVDRLGRWRARAEGVSEAVITDEEGVAARRVAF